MAIEVPQNEEISGGGKNGGREWRSKRGSIHIKK